MAVPRRVAMTGWVVLGALLASVWPVVASAREGHRAVVLPTVVEARHAGESRPIEAAEPRLVGLSHRVDGLVDDAAQDLGLSVELRSGVDPAVLRAMARDEDNLAAVDAAAWVISPRLLIDGDRLRLRLVAVPPGSTVQLVRSQQVTEAELGMRVVVMLTELVAAHRARPLGASRPDAPTAPVPTEPVAPQRSEGRAVLALTSAALGGWVGYSLQRASGSDDPRLTYPLIALGTGVGLGAAMVAADEWDMSSGDAWYVSAGAVWPALSGQLLAGGYRVEPASDRYVYGMVGTASGMALSSFALSTGDMSEGGALLAHSGGAFGTILGGLTQMAYRGRTDFVPRLGLGYGAGLGVLTTGLLATQVDMSPSRGLFIDIAGGLGGVAGAAVASPILFVDVDPVPESRERIWLGSVGVGILVGLGAGWYLTRHAQPEDARTEKRAQIRPFVLPVDGGSLGASARGPSWLCSVPEQRAISAMEHSSLRDDGWLVGVEGLW